MFNSAIPMDIQHKINLFNKHKQENEVEQAFYWIDQACRDLEKIHDWYHVDQYAKEGVVLAREHMDYAYEGLFLVWLTYVANFLRDKSLLIAYTNDYIKALSNQVKQYERDPKAEERLYNNPQIIDNVIEKIGRQKKFLELIKEDDFIWF